MLQYCLCLPVDIDDNETNQQLRMAYELGQNNSFGLNDFSYSSDALLNIIFGHLSNTSFNGITVSMHVQYRS